MSARNIRIYPLFMEIKVKIGIIGIGRLGLCFALNLSNSGFNVIGYDIDKKYIDLLSSKNFNSTEPCVNELLYNCCIDFTTNISDVMESDIIFIFVNTPSNLDGSFDHSQVDSVLSGLNNYDRTIVICSTVMPGYCDYIKDKRIIYNPQFIAQGSIIQGQLYPDLVLIGVEEIGRDELVKEIYSVVCKNSPVVKVMDCLSAEVTKLALNCYITTKISFANSLGDICKNIGADCDAVLSAISSDTRIGSKCFSYGYGYGGPCFPRDNKAFIHFAKNHVIPYLSEATEKVNEDHLLQQLKLIEKNNLPSNVEIVGDHAIITGVCFKQESKILDESQQLRLAFELTKKYKVTIRDSDVVINELKEKYEDIFLYEAIL